MVHKNCPICKIEFKVIPALKNVTITCGNKSCIKKWMSISRIGNNNNNYRGGKNKKCLVCGKSFYVGPVKSKTRKCCSRKCAGIIHSKAMSGEGNSRFGEGAKRVCKFCGKKYRSSPSLRLKFCSQKCYDNFKVGKNHPSWKGGKPQNYCIDCGNKIGYYSKRCNKCKFKKERAPNWQGGKSFEKYGLEFDDDLKKLIRKRDKYECQICFKNQKQLKRKLHVHHIDKNKKNNDIKNLVAVCIHCHMKLHRKK